MEEFTDEHAKLLLNREWLVKVDSAKATPYLFKYYTSLVDLSCCIMITDIKSVWAEVLTPKLVARRWRSCNKESPEYFTDPKDEETWRERLLELLSNAHTMGGILDMSFEIVESSFSDLAFELESEGFKWKWQPCFLGHKKSSEIISKHLIFPLISLNHLAFSSAEALSEMPDSDVEKAVDKLGRTARRAVDNHVKNALSKPKVATAIRRATAMFNFMPDLSTIVSTADKPSLELDESDLSVPNKSSDVMQKSIMRQSPSLVIQNSVQLMKAPMPTKPAQPESATESESEDDKPATTVNRPHITSDDVLNQSSGSSLKPIGPPGPASQPAEPPSISESPPPRPTKKPRPSSPSSSDNDSDTNIKSRAVSAAASSTNRRTTKQPIKRGGKRF